jgi:hypothetical protein
MASVLYLARSERREFLGESIGPVPDPDEIALAAARGAHLPRWIVWIVAILGVMAMLVHWSGKFNQIRIGGNDFLDLYAGGKLVTDPGLYNPARVEQVQWAAAGVSGPAFLFSRPPAFAALLAPLALLPYRTAYFVFQALSLLAVVLAVLLWPAREDRGPIAFACCWSVPLSAAFANGQDVPFLLLWLSIVARLIDRRPALAGIVASLCMAKFHLFLLLPLWILSQKRWRFGAGLAGGLLACLAASFALQGPDWIQRYIHLVRNPIEDTDQATMRNLHGLCAAFGLPLAVELALCGAVAWFVWRACHRDPESAWLATLTGGLLVSRHAYMQDCVILLPLLVATLRAERNALPVRALAGILLLPALYMPLPDAWRATAIVPALMLALVVMCSLRGAGPAGAPYRGSSYDAIRVG